MAHPSPQDPEKHYTVFADSLTGNKRLVGHVTVDASKQQVGTSILP